MRFSNIASLLCLAVLFSSNIQLASATAATCVFSPTAPVFYPLGNAMSNTLTCTGGSATSTITACALTSPASLPAGLSLTASVTGTTCVLAGTPTALAASATYTIATTDTAGSNGNPAAATIVFAVTGNCLIHFLTKLYKFLNSALNVVLTLPSLLQIAQRRGHLGAPAQQVRYFFSYQLRPNVIKLELNTQHIECRPVLLSYRDLHGMCSWLVQ